MLIANSNEMTRWIAAFSPAAVEDVDEKLDSERNCCYMLLRLLCLMFIQKIVVIVCLKCSKNFHSFEEC